MEVTTYITGYIMYNGVCILAIKTRDTVSVAKKAAWRTSVLFTPANLR